MNETKLKEFDIKSVTFRLGTSPKVLIIGRRSTGKTFLAGEILKHHQDLPRGTIIAGLEEERQVYSNIVPTATIHKEYDPSIIEDIAKNQRQIYKGIKDWCAESDSLKTFVVLDNCFYDQTWYQEKHVRFLFTHGCNYKIMSILTMNHPLGIPPVLRSQIEYIFVLKESYLQNRRRIWEHYCSEFITFENFCKIMDQTTNNHDCLVINNHAKTNNIEDIFFWYRGHNI